MWSWMPACVAVPPPGEPFAVDVEVTSSEAVVCAADARGPWVHQSLPDGPRAPAAELDSGGLAVADLDGDGWPDVFVAHHARSTLVFGSADGLVDGTARLAGLDLDGAVGAVAVDVEGDGDLDLFVTRWQRPNVLLANDGAGTFVDVTELAGLGGTTDRHQSASFADADRDGDVDVFVGSYGPEPGDDRFDDPDLPPSVDRKHLYLQVGPGRFEEHSELLPADLHDGYTFQSGWFDLEGDGFPELFVWNDFGTAHPSRALSNLDGRAFIDLPGSGVDRPFEDMGVGVGDLGGDGLPDFVTTSYRRMGLLESARVGDSVVWVDGAAARGLTVQPAQEFGWGVELGDLDHDGDEDLVASFGRWSRYDGTPPRQPDEVWLLGDDGAFEPVAATYGLANDGVGRGVVLADVDLDGFLDLLRHPLDHAAVISSSPCDATSWLSVELRQRSADTRALGARITAISPGGRRQTRWVRAGSSSLYSSGPPAQHFGFGGDPVVDLEIRWPDGATTAVSGVQTRRRVTVVR